MPALAVQEDRRLVSVNKRSVKSRGISGVTVTFRSVNRDSQRRIASISHHYFGFIQPAAGRSQEILRTLSIWRDRKDIDAGLDEAAFVPFHERLLSRMRIVTKRSPMRIFTGTINDFIFGDHHRSEATLAF